MKNLMEIVMRMISRPGFMKYWDWPPIPIGRSGQTTRSLATQDLHPRTPSKDFNVQEHATIVEVSIISLRSAPMRIGRTMVENSFARIRPRLLRTRTSQGIGHQGHYMLKKARLRKNTCPVMKMGMRLYVWPTSP